MKSIYPAIKTIRTVCGEQKQNEKTAYRMTNYCLETVCGEGMLLFHTMTGELLLISREEWENRISDKKLREELVRRWFLVPLEHRERSHCDQLMSVLKLVEKPDKTIRNFQILNTTDCNARCYYCFELGRPRQHMNEKTAQDVANYIVRVSGGGMVKLRWFGGEPLYNIPAIDTIVKTLKDRGLDYRSIMVSNGYLFDESLVKKAKEIWKLKEIQITLDGTEEVYNRTKAYIYRDGNPFQRVIENITLLLDAEIKASVRLNMDLQNADNLEQLVTLLAERFSDREGIYVYVGMLTDFNHRGIIKQGEQTIERYRDLFQRIRDCGLNNDTLKSKVSINCCMADTDNSITILPDGRLGKCDEETEEKLIGSIYEEELDQQMINRWKERVSLPQCNSCTLYPRCRRLKLCPWEAQGCTEMRRQQEIVFLENEILNTYKKARAAYETD